MTDEQPQVIPTLQQVAEALIFAANEPVTTAEIAGTYAVTSREDPPGESAVAEAVSLLNDAYESGGHVLRIERWAGDTAWPRLMKRPLFCRNSSDKN